MEKISVSICCPVYNEEKNIESFIRSVLEDACSLAVEWELILWLSGCTDRTAEIILDNFSQENRLQVVVEDKRLGKANAINKLRRKARGKYLIFTDSDVIWQKGSCNLLIASIQGNMEIGIVVGQVKPIKPGSCLIDRVNLLSFDYWHRLRKKQDEGGVLWSIPGQIYAIRKSLAIEIPNGTVNEDAFVGKRVRDRGYLLRYEPRAVVYIDYPREWKAFFVQKARTRSGWIQQVSFCTRDVFILHSQLRKMVLRDIFSRNPGRKYRIILLLVDILSFFLGWYQFKRFSAIELVKWRRIHQDLTRENHNYEENNR